MKTFTCRCRGWTTGHASSGITRAASFSASGIFRDAGCQLSPRCYFWSPALHIHPATDTLLHYISPEIDWTLVGIDERWREGVRVIFRKRAQVQNSAERHADKGDMRLPIAN